MNVECYAGNTSVALVDGSIPLEGLVVLKSDKYVCWDGFTVKAAELVCGELGFPAARGFTGQSLANMSINATRNKTHVLACPQDPLRLKECSMTTTECSSNRIVRLKCREPGFLGCYKGDQLNFRASFNAGFEVELDSECVSACRRQPGSNGVAVMHQGMCTCMHSENYVSIHSAGNLSHNWTCPPATENESDRHFSFNLSVGFCDHPDIVPNGLWESNITSFGSEITLTCDKGYVVNGSATMQCVGLPGWSTYFPVWNASDHSCAPVKNAEWQDVNTSTIPTQHTENTSSGQRQTTQALTSLRDTSITSPLDSGFPERNFVTYILGTLFGVLFVVLIILSLAWCKHQQKRHWSSQTSHQPHLNPHGGQFQLHPIDNSVQVAVSRDHVVSSDATNTDTRADGSFLTQILANTVGTSTAHLVNPNHIYQDAAEVDDGLCNLNSATNINMNTAIGTSLTSLNVPSSHEYCGLQETSLNLTASGYDDDEYQDVELCKLDRMTNGAVRSTGKVCLFDDYCYNSLTSFQNSCEVYTESEYDHINHPHAKITAGCHDPNLPSIGQPCQHEICPDRKDSKSYCCKDPLTALPSQDVFYYQLNPEQQNDTGTSKRPQWPDAFDSVEYSVLKPEKDSSHDLYPTMMESINANDCPDTKSENSNRFISLPQTPEEMYATMNKTAGTVSVAELSPCEELYAQVDKTRGACRNESEPTIQEELYMNITDM